jgi:outer membrane protein
MTPAVGPSGLLQPTPFPQYTLGPASVGTAMPFPAYGSPVPGVGVGPAPTAVPQVVTLAQAEAIAFARTPTLASARADEGIAHASKRLAQTGYYPNLSAQADTSRSNRQPGSAPNPNSTAFTTSTTSSTSNSLSVNLRQLIFDGGRVAASIRAASYSEAASIDTYRFDLDTVALNVAETYYAELQAQRTTAVAVETVQLDLVQEDLVRAQLAAGVATQVDLATAQLPTAQARVALVKAQAAELSAQATFANAMGLDANVDVLPFDDTPVSATGAISTIPVPTYDQAIARAYLLRPDYAAAEHSVQASRASLQGARLQWFPTLTGSASAGTSSTDVTGGTFRNANSIGATLSIPIYDQGVTAADILQQRYQVDKALAQMDVTRNAIQLAVKQALVNLVGARSQVDEAQAEYTKAVQVLNATQAQYRYGVTTLPLLLNAQVGLTTALSDQVTAVYNLRQAEQTYLFAVGANTP